MKITLSSFGGIVPRAPEHRLAEVQARLAHNCKLRNGILEAWREPCFYKDVPASARSLYMYGCCLYTWDNVVTVAEVSPDYARVFVAGNTEKPQVMVRSSCCDMDTYYLGVPQPTDPPHASCEEACVREADFRNYVYTYINKWGEESAPSPASNTVLTADGVPVSVTNIALPPDGYGIVGANIYRAVTGFREVNAKQQTPLTDYVFIDTIYFPTTTYTDTVTMDSVGMILDTGEVCLPPDGLQNITSIESTVRLAGSVANRIYMTENFQPYNWPVKYQLTLDSGIVHMKNFDQRLFVSTSTTPYVIDVSSCDDTKCMPVEDVGVPLPDISCGHYNSAIMTPFGMVYSSPLGAVLINAAAKWTLLTAKWFSEDDWKQMAPDTARFEYWEGYLFIVTDRASFLLDIDGDPYGDAKLGELSTISDAPIAMHRTNTGQLLLLQNGKVTIWNQGAEYRPYEWESRELTSPDHTITSPGKNYLMPPTDDSTIGCQFSPAALRVRSVLTHVSLINPRDKVVYERNISDGRTVRLPKVGRHMFYRLKFQGTEPVEYADMGTAVITTTKGA